MNRFQARGEMSTVTDVAIPGGWSDREVVVGKRPFRLLVPSDPDALLEQLESPSNAEQPHFADPYWAKLWPAAPLLAEAIVRSPPPARTRVLELGCGSGLVGIAALAVGLDVTLSDYVPFAVKLALENAARNGFPQAKGLVLDWRQPRDEHFDLVVAADVTYDRTNLEPLLAVCDKMLAPGGEAWFGDAGRGPAADFVNQALDCGWAVSLYDEDDQPFARTALGHYRRIVLRRPARRN
jgi:predicted nicotinamide N-methyase